MRLIVYTHLTVCLNQSKLLKYNEGEGNNKTDQLFKFYGMQIPPQCNTDYDDYNDDVEDDNDVACRNSLIRPKKLPVCLNFLLCSLPLH